MKWIAFLISGQSKFHDKSWERTPKEVRNLSSRVKVDRIEHLEKQYARNKNVSTLRNSNLGEIMVK